MPPCVYCSSVSYCQSLSTNLINDYELSNPDFIRDLREFCFRQNISSHHWHDFLIDLYRDYRGHIFDRDGRETQLNTCVLETPNIREWFRDFCCKPCPPHITPYVRGEARERVRVMGTILRAYFPNQAAFWGMRAANDNQNLLCP